MRLVFKETINPSNDLKIPLRFDIKHKLHGVYIAYFDKSCTPSNIAKSVILKTASRHVLLNSILSNKD